MAVSVPYPPQTRNFHYEIELVVAIGVGGAAIPIDRASNMSTAYTVGNDLTRRDLQLLAREQGRPWIGGRGSICLRRRPVDTVKSIGHPTKGRLWLAVTVS